MYADSQKGEDGWDVWIYGRRNVEHAGCVRDLGCAPGTIRGQGGTCDRRRRPFQEVPTRPARWVLDQKRGGSGATRWHIGWKKGWLLARQ